MNATWQDSHMHAQTQSLAQGKKPFSQNMHPKQNRKKKLSSRCAAIEDVTFRLHISISVVYEFISFSLALSTFSCGFCSHFDVMLRLVGVLLSDPYGFIPIECICTACRVYLFHSTRNSNGPFPKSGCNRDKHGIPKSKNIRTFQTKYREQALTDRKFSSRRMLVSSCYAEQHEQDYC